MNCPKCLSTQIIKYGNTHYGKPRFRCQACKRQFVEDATRQPIDRATRQLIDKLLLERLALAAIARVTGVSERWLQMYVNQKFYQTPSYHWSYPKKPGRLTIHLDEMWSRVGSKANKQWVWLAIDADSREIVGVFVGARSRQGAKGLWQSLPAVYRQCAHCYTDFWEAYEQVLPSKRPKSSGQRNRKNQLYRAIQQQFAAAIWAISS